MQPLALHNASISADVGDSSAASTAPAKGSGGAVFNELMAAAAPAASSDGSADAPVTPVAADGQDAGQADQDVAALAAATQLATRGVTLKAAPASAEVRLTVATPNATDINSDLSASDLTEGHDDANAEDNTDAQAKTDTSDAIQAADPASMNVQALIQMAVQASITVSDGAHETKGEAESDATPSALEGIADASKIDATLNAVNYLTPHQNADDGSTLQGADGADAEVGQAVSPPRIAALQAVAWFDSKASKPLKDGEQAEIDNTEQAASLAEPQAVNASDAIDADRADEAQAHAKAQSDDPAVQQAQPIVLEPAAFAIANAPASATTDEPVESDDPLLQPAKQPLQQWSDAATARAATTASQGRVTQNQASDDEAAALSKDWKPAEVSTPIKAPTTDNDDGGVRTMQSIVRGLEVSTGPSSSVSGLAQFNPDALAREANAVVAPQHYAVSEFVPKKNDAQNADSPKSDTEKNETEQDAEADSRTEPAAKGSIHIRELLKLGVTDVTLHHVAQAAVQQDQTETLPLIPVQDISSTLSTTPQTSTVATTNVETNGERRSIADDIRLRALERMVVNAARNGTQMLSIQLYPPGLGQVVLRLAMDGQRLRLATRTATTEAADTLRNMETDLRNALAGNGLQLTGFDVSEDGTNDEAPRRQPVEPVVKIRNGGTDESFTVELNA